MENEDEFLPPPPARSPHRDRRLRSHGDEAGEGNNAGDGDCDWVAASSSNATRQRPQRIFLEVPVSEVAPLRTASHRTADNAAVARDEPLRSASDTRTQPRRASSRGRRRHSYNTRSSRRRAGNTPLAGDGPAHARVETRRNRGRATEGARVPRIEASLPFSAREPDVPGEIVTGDAEPVASDEFDPSPPRLPTDHMFFFRRGTRPRAAHDTPEEEDEHPNDYGQLDEHLSRLSSRTSLSSSHLMSNNEWEWDAISRIRGRAGLPKRNRDRYDTVDGKDTMTTLMRKAAVAVMIYQSVTPDPEANDVWPHVRNTAKLPVRYYLCDREARVVQTPESRIKRYNLREALRPPKILKFKGKVPRLEQAPADDPQLPSIVWPAAELPTELYEDIVSYLNRDDIKSMRLVCREFDRHISQTLFRTAVVPFNTEIYGMLERDEKPDPKGKKKVKVDKLIWNNANDDDVYNGHGLDVFRGFGERIHKFGMSFDWPYEDYRRFDDVAGLESAADETPRMKEAFSELKKVRELGLSLDSGLGWLNGPDRSIRARVLQRQPTVFGTSKRLPDRRAQAQQELWDHIESKHEAAESDVRIATLYKIEGGRAVSDFQDVAVQPQPEMPYLDPRIISEAIPHETNEPEIPTSFDDPEQLVRLVATPSSGCSGSGVLFSSTTPPSDWSQLQSPILPRSLTKAQTEWLLETEWAQRAFLSSYMLSIIDNSTLGTFQNVHTLNISQLSDRYIPMLNRRDFWESLPSLRKVILMVIPGWRTVIKDEAGFVDTPLISPTAMINSFYALLRNITCRRDAVVRAGVSRCNIDKLTIGWVGGGEHAEGLHARNSNILPAPILPTKHATEQDPAVICQNLLEFPYVEELTLKNCWITPPVLRQLVLQHDKHRLKSLVLDSASLTAMLRNPANVNGNNGNQGGIAGLFGGNNGNNALQGHPNIATPQQIMQLQIQATQVQIQQIQGQNQQATLTTLQNQLQAQIQQFLQMHPHNPANQVNVAAQNPAAAPPWAQLPNQNWGQQNGQNNFIAAIQAFINANPQPAGNHAAQVQNAVPQMPQNPRNMLKSQPPREGSWLHTLDIISPSLNLSDFENPHSLADSERQTSLTSISFISCGYAKLPYLAFDQSAIEDVTLAVEKNPFFTKRHHTISGVMLGKKFPLLGEIVQNVDATELGALAAGWYLQVGWQGELEMEKKAPEFDGWLPGGTGRFTGTVRKSDRLRSEEEVRET
ncbi:hypothetical protein BCR34DRAFT_579707 [Clohesyomyces aquaticus]|uniref:F-box domain-containing protein n=1 Tax=Clohesyomyces aquaticus TaxID=1231657 RepID=A0A1Y1YA75_9PLEO|nr:hypothetical protein BCR34DRAFT_579707 [Clohesyomyces aquaticus]